MTSEKTLIDPCTQYALDVVGGKRIVGLLEKQSCQRHLNDLEKQNDPNFPWRFEPEKADLIYRWFSYCEHIEGPLAGTPIELQAFQKFDLGCIFGWINKETGFRRFVKAFIEEARKNGKSTLMSGIALYLMCGDKEEEPKVYCAAVDRDQAKIVYNAAKRMAIKSPDIRKRLRIRNYQTIHVTRGGRLIPLSKETKNKDGLNPSGVIIDEYHAHPTSEIYDLLWSAFGQRSQALMLIITTAGKDAEKSPCWKEYKYCKQILSEEIVNDRYFVMIREMDKDDNEHDPKNWIKSNPLRAATPQGLQILKEQHDEVFSSQDPDKIRTFRIKILNKWVYDSENSYMGDFLERLDKLAISKEEFNKLTKGLPCIVGFDLSKIIDLTAVGILFLLPDNRIAFTAHGFMPETAITRHEKTDKIPYRDWAEQGWLTKTNGDVTDYDEIKIYAYDMELQNNWKIIEFAYDPYNATHLATQIQNQDGYECVEIRQGKKTLSEPSKLLRTKIAKGEAVWEWNPLLKWCFANAKEDVDNNENIQVIKRTKDDTQRIDPLSAVINAMVRLPKLEEIAHRDISDEILDDNWSF